MQDGFFSLKTVELHILKHDTNVLHQMDMPSACEYPQLLIFGSLLGIPGHCFTL